MATITSTATGNWSAGGTWVGGVAPVSADDAVIASGHTVTKDTAAGADDCASLTVNSGGELDIGTNGIKVGGAVTNNGVLKMGAGGLLEFGATMGASAGAVEFIGAAGNHCEVKFTSGTSGSARGLYCRGSAASAYSRMRYIDFEYVYIVPTGWNEADYLRDFTTKGVGSTNSAFVSPGTPYCHFVLVKDGFVDGWFAPLGGNFSGHPIHFVGVEFGATAAMTYLFAGNNHNYAWFYNCKFTNHTNWTYNYASIWIARFSPYKERGDWLVAMPGGRALRSAESKKAGDYGTEVVPESICAAGYPVWFDIQYPVSSGDSLAPAFFYKNVGDDLDLEAGADRFVAECDLGNLWGLNETIDVNGGDASYDAWRQVSFAGGIAGGTDEEGMLTIRIWLKRYVAGASVYVADAAF